MSNSDSDHLINIKVCVKLGRNVYKMCEILSEAHGTEAVHKSSAFKWHKWFRGGGGDMEDAGRSSHQEVHRSDKNVETIWRILVISN
jgi:hypothetical protein